MCSMLPGILQQLQRRASKIGKELGLSAWQDSGNPKLLTIFELLSKDKPPLGAPMRCWAVRIPLIKCRYLEDGAAGELLLCYSLYFGEFSIIRGSLKYMTLM